MISSFRIVPSTYAEPLNDHAPQPVAVPTDWESVVALTRELVEDESNKRFQIGWLANDVDRAFTQRRGRKKISDALPMLASEVGIAIQTLKKYAWVGSTFGPDDVAQFVPPLTFSYFQVVTRVARKGNRDEVFALLEQAATEQWSVSQLDAEVNIRKDTPRPFTVAGRPTVVTTQMGTVVGVLVEGEADTWMRALTDNNLAETLVKATFKSAV